MQEIYIPPTCGDGLNIKDSVSVNDPFAKFMETQLVLDYGEHSNPERQPLKKIHLSPPVSDDDCADSM